MCRINELSLSTITDNSDPSNQGSISPFHSNGGEQSPTREGERCSRPASTLRRYPPFLQKWKKSGKRTKPSNPTRTDRETGKRLCMCIHSKAGALSLARHPYMKNRKLAS